MSLPQNGTRHRSYGPYWKSRRVEYQHGAAQSFDYSIPKKRNHPAKYGNRDISPVVDSRRWSRTNHHIAHDPTRDACGKGQDQDPKRSSLCFTAAIAPLSAKTKVPAKSKA